MSVDLATYAEAINDAWNSHDIERVIPFYSPDYIGEDVGQTFLLHGHQSLRDLLKNYWEAFPDLKFEILSTLVEGDRVAIVWIGEGTHQGRIMNIPPTGRKVRARGVSILDVKDGLVMGGQTIWDLAGMLRHMGLLPELQAAKESTY